MELKTKEPGKKMEEDEERQAGRRRGRERWCVVGLQSKAPIFNLNRPRYVIRTVG